MATRRGVKPWRDEETLRELYVIRDMTLDGVGEQLGCARSTVGNWLGKFDIETASEGRPAATDRLKDREHLRELYWDDGLSLSQIANRHDCSHGTIRRWMIKHNIPRQNRADALPCGENHPNAGLDEGAPGELSDGDWLQREYEVNKRSSYDIADSLGVAPGTVLRQLRRHSIKIRPRGGGAGEHNPRRKDRVTIVCDYCGEENRRLPNLVGRGGRDFCNHECKHAFHAENRVIKSCSNCGGDVSVRPNRKDRSDHNFCDKSCFNQWLSESGARVGENHPQWKPGTIEGCGPGWQEKREEVRERDGYCCQSCGMGEARHKNKFNRELPVHHISPRREFAGSDGEIDWAAANALDNLITLCDQCHPKWEQMAPLRPDTGDVVSD